ncbi:AraC family transcriptional regulator [Lachnospiraceae bacterium 62-35]
MEDAFVLEVPERKFSDLYMCFCGYAKCEPFHSYGPALRPHYIIHYILEGKGRYRAGNTQYELEKGQGFLIEPEAQTFYEADGEMPWTYLWIGFDGTRAKEYLKDIGLGSGRLIYSSSHGAELKSIILNMLKNNTVSLRNQFLLEGLLYSFFSILAEDIALPDGSDPGVDNLYVKQAVGYIQDNYFNPIKVTDIAGYVCINRSYLYTLFRKAMGISPQEYLADYRIVRGAELLSSTDLSIESIALSCGYRDSLTFTRAFKAKRGMAPSWYRKHDRERKKG